jgi:hypothetical protein
MVKVLARDMVTGKVVVRVKVKVKVMLKVMVKVKVKDMLLAPLNMRIKVRHNLKLRK